MDKKTLRIVYMGTPEFAVEPLKKLVSEQYNVVAVITMPDKPIGRHQNELSASPVKKYAIEHGIKVLQPEKLKNPLFLDELRSLQADLQIVVAFRMLPEVVWAMPRLGTFNLHAALLPQYRGAAPINWAIINGETQTGITTFFLDKEIDTGNIIQRVTVPILDTDNAEVVHDKLMYLGSDLVKETVDNIIAGTVKVVPQTQLETNEPLHTAPKIFKETCRIDWTQNVKHIYDFIRGLSPYPTAWTNFYNGNEVHTLKIFTSEKEFCQSKEPYGTIVTDFKTYFKVALCDGYLHLTSLQLAGKRRMLITDFLNGLRSYNQVMRVC